MQEALPTALTPDRVMFDLPGGNYRDALRSLLAPYFASDADKLQRVLDRLCKCEEEFPSEVREGIALPHALMSGLESPILFLGISGEGVHFPNVSRPVHVVLVLLGPRNKRHDHLRLLTHLAGLLRKSDNLEELKTVRGLEELFGWFGKQGTTAEKGGKTSSDRSDRN